jgi:hypothetical protein
MPTTSEGGDSSSPLRLNQIYNTKQ